MGHGMRESLIWSLAGAMIAIGLETLYKTRGAEGAGFPLWAVIPAIALTYCIYKALTTSEATWLITMAGYSLFTVLVRVVVSSAILHEAVARGNAVAASALLVASIIGRLWV